MISPASAMSPVVSSVSHATRPPGSCSSTASRIASETWSAILSGCPSVTDSEVKTYLPVRRMWLLPADGFARGPTAQPSTRRRRTAAGAPSLRRRLPPPGGGPAPLRVRCASPVPPSGSRVAGFVHRLEPRLEHVRVESGSSTGPRVPGGSGFERRSAPRSSRCVANECRNTCGLMLCGSPARRACFFQHLPAADAAQPPAAAGVDEQPRR